MFDAWPALFRCPCIHAPCSLALKSNKTTWATKSPCSARRDRALLLQPAQRLRLERSLAAAPRWAICAGCKPCWPDGSRALSKLLMPPVPELCGSVIDPAPGECAVGLLLVLRGGQSLRGSRVGLAVHRRNCRARNRLRFDLEPCCCS